MRFDERVNAQIEAEVNGSAAEVQLSEDYRTVKIAAEGLGETASLKMRGICDIYGNAQMSARAQRSLPQVTQRMSLAPSKCRMQKEIRI